MSTMKLHNIILSTTVILTFLIIAVGKYNFSYYCHWAIVFLCQSKSNYVSISNYVFNLQMLIVPIHKVKISARKRYETENAHNLRMNAKNPVDTVLQVNSN